MKHDSITIDGIEYRPFDHLYHVSKCGLILKKFKPYSPYPMKAGYLRAGKRLVHRMVATCWIRPPEKGEQIHHINHNKSDNRVENLEWTSQYKHLVEKHPETLENLKRSSPTKEHRQHLRELRLGQKHSPETKAKISASLKKMGHKPAPRTGKRSAEEMAKRMDNPIKATACIVNGIKYISFAAASRETGIHRFTVRKRCLSPNFPEYELVPPS